MTLNATLTHRFRSSKLSSGNPIASLTVPSESGMAIWLRKSIEPDSPTSDISLSMMARTTPSRALTLCGVNGACRMRRDLLCSSPSWVRTVVAHGYSGIRCRMCSGGVAGDRCPVLENVSVSRSAARMSLWRAMDHIPTPGVCETSA